MRESDDGDSKEQEEDDDPVHAGLKRLGDSGKKRLFIKEEIVNSTITETSPSILTKEPVRILETVNLNLTDLKEPKRKRSRIKRNIN